MWKFLMSILVLSLFASCDQSMLRSTAQPDQPKYDITETDIFAIPDIHGEQVTVFGIGLGDSKERVLVRLGDPDSVMEFPDIDTVNFEYAARLNMTNPGLLIQLRNGTVAKMTVKQPFNQYLHGKTIIEHTKEDIYFKLLGVPDSQEDHALLRIFYYEDEGFEVFVKKGLMNGFSITASHPVKSPKRKLPVDANSNI